MANATDFVNRMIFESIGYENVVRQLREAGVKQSDLVRLKKEMKRASEEEVQALEKTNKALMSSATTFVKLHDKVKSSLSAGGAPTSAARLFGLDPDTAQFAKYQREVQKIAHSMRNATKPEDLAGYQVALDQVARKYGQINAEIARMAGFKPTDPVNSATMQQYAAVVQAMRKFKDEQATIAATSRSVVTGLTQQEMAAKRLADMYKAVETPLERAKRQLTDVSQLAPFAKTEQEIVAVIRRTRELMAEIAKLNAVPKDSRFSDLQMKYDPYAQSAANRVRLQEQFATVRAGIASGTYDEATANRIVQNIRDHAKAERERGKAHQDTALKAHFSTNQMLQYTAAVRNTAESLASGMSITTVAMTQGMQVIGATVGESFATMAKLGAVAVALTPVILAVMRAMSLASQEREIKATSLAYNNLTTSVERTAEAVRVLADNSKYSRTEIMEAVKELTKMHTLSVEMRQGIQGAITPFATATGQTPVEATKELIKAFDGTYESIRRLDQTYNFLSASQLENIRLMMKQGQVTEATRIAMKAFTDQMGDAAKAASSEAGDAFKDMAKAWNDALDSMANSPATQALLKVAAAIGNVTANAAGGPGDDDPVRRMEWAQRRRKELSVQSWQVGSNAPTQIMALDKEIADLQQRIDAGRSVLNSEGRYRRGETARVESGKADKALTDITGEYEKQLKLAQAIGVERAKIEGAQRAKEAALARGVTSTDELKRVQSEGAAQAAAVAQVEIDRHTAALYRQADAQRELATAALRGGRAQAEARANAAAREAAATGQNAAAARAVSLMNDESSALTTLYGQLYKLGEQEDLVRVARERGIDAATTEMRIRELAITSVQGERKAREALAQVAEREAQARLRAGQAADVASGGRIGLMGASNDNLSGPERAFRTAQIAAQEQNAVSPNEHKYADAIAAAARARSEANAAEGQSIRQVLEPRIALQQRLAAIEAATGVAEADRAVMRRQAEKDYEDALLKRLQMEEDWLSGVERGWLRYKQSVGTWSDQMEGFVTSAFSHMEDAFVNMAMTGKMNFADMANAIIADLIRITIRMQMMSAVEDMGGMGGIAKGVVGLFGSMFTGGSTVDAGSVGASTVAAHGMAFDGGGVAQFARGGSFANTVVNGVTPFRFASGGAMRNGVMGEAGPEAIVPLTRTAQGDLGVRSVGGGAQVNVEVIDQRGANAAPIDVETQMGAFGPIVRIIARDEAQKAVAGYSKGGGLTADMRQTYNIRQPAVNRG